MQISTKQWLSIAGVIIILAASAIFFILRPGNTPAGIANATTTGSNATTSIQFPETRTIGGVTGTGDFTVQPITSNTSNLPPTPNFNAPIAFSADVAPDVRAQITSNVDILRGRLQKDATDLRSWLQLGGLYEMAGDYADAETFWTYVTKAAPTNVIAYANLGDLYQSYLKNYAKAETEYLKVIQIDPADIDAYRALYQMYSTVYKTGTSATENILKQGITADPKAVDLQVLLARYYKSQGMTAQANAEYDAAIANANSQGETSLAAQIQQEKS
jgi:tetratricopeptide (TPR) repeat protein